MDLAYSISMFKKKKSHVCWGGFLLNAANFIREIAALLKCAVQRI